MSGFKDEKTLWSYMKPLLNGKWWRVETIMPEGFTDAMGIYNGNLVFLELKVGVPSIKALRSSQIDFLRAVEKGAEVWVAFGSKTAKEITFVRGLEFEYTKTHDPTFWAGPVTLR